MALLSTGASSVAAAGELPAIEKLGQTVSLREAYGGPLVFDSDRPHAGGEAFRIGAKVRAGAVPGSGRRAIVGTTAVTVVFNRNLKAERDNDHIWAKLNGSAFSLLEFESVRSRHCKNAVRWNAGDSIFGRQTGVTCRRSLRLRTANPVQLQSIRSGPARWEFELESYGRPLVRRVKVRKASRIAYTDRAYDEIRLERVPRSVSVVQGEVVRIPFSVSNVGGRAAPRVEIDGGYGSMHEITLADADIPAVPGVTFLKPVLREWPRLGVGRTVRSFYRVRGDMVGTFPVWIFASGGASGDHRNLTIEVTSPGG